ncbi:hypothetical protein DV736_g2530, partial [Chaetothyriales sp. CBS 134916]
MPMRNSVENQSTIVAAYVLYFAVTFATLLLEIPLVRLFERSICTRYYHASVHESTLGNGVDESLCKVAAIQDELSMVVGWQMSFNALAGLLTAIYYGRLAERKGRKHVLLLSSSGMILMFVWVVVVCQTGAKVELVWLSSIFLLLGGGLRVFNGMCVAAVSDAVADEERARYLYLLHAGPHANKVLAPRVAAALMAVDLLWPFFCSFVVFGAVLLIISLFYSDIATEGISKTKHDYSAIPQNSPGDQHERLLAPPNVHDASHANSPLDEQPPIPTSDDNTSTQAIPWYLSVISDLKRLFSPHIAIFCLVAFLFKRIAFASESFVFQYMSEQFEWSLRDTTWLRLTHGVEIDFSAPSLHQKMPETHPEGPVSSDSPKAQPWRSIWPVERPSQPQAQIYGFKKGETMVFDGNAGNFFVKDAWKIENASN